MIKDEKDELPAAKRDYFGAFPGLKHFTKEDRLKSKHE